MASDFLEVFGDWLVDGATVEQKLGDGVEGTLYAAAAAADQLMVEDKQRMVRTSDGVEVLSTRTLYVHRGHPALAAFNPGAIVNFPDGRKSHVLELNDLAAYGVVDHLVVRCE